MSDFIQITTTSDKKEILQLIASQLVGSHLAACVQIGGPIESVYRWQARVETAQEWICTIKTTSRCQKDAVAMIETHHNYDVPEIIVTPIVAGGVGYLNWLTEQTDA